MAKLKQSVVDEINDRLERYYDENNAPQYQLAELELYKGAVYVDCGVRGFVVHETRDSEEHSVTFSGSIWLINLRTDKQTELPYLHHYKVTYDKSRP